MDLYRVYAFTRNLPRLVGVLESLVESCNPQERHICDAIREKFLTKLSVFIDKFSKYQALIEHVVDLDRLPDLEVNHKHDSQLAELRDESDSLNDKVEE